jgi:DNA-binding response OmpR family regulator
VKVLLVDDDTDLLDVITYALRRDGFSVIAATDGLQAMQRWQEDRPDLLVCDVSMPGLNGFEVCHRIRQTSTTPVILLTALNSEEQIIKGFSLGADDYVTKPFSPRQLAMRIRAVWRRGGQATDPEPVRKLQIGELTLDSESHEVYHRDRQILLTTIEFKLLYILAANAGRVVTSSRLVEYAWGYEGGDISVLKTHVSHIRTKLRLARPDLATIRAVPQVGYRLTLRDDANAVA